VSRRLQAAAKRAKSSGLSGKHGPRKQTAKCKFAGGAAKGDPVGGAGGAASEEHEYEECVLRELVIEINDASKSQAISLTKQRHQEPVQAKVAEEYKGMLPSYDLVVEALSGVSLSNRSKHLRITAQSFNGSRHSSWQPLHPHTQIGEHEADAGQVVNAEFPVPTRDGFLQNWLAIWPFSGERTQYATISGEACGRQKPAAAGGPAPLRSLSVRLVVLPQEEWTFSIKGTKAYGKTKTWTGDVKRQGEKGNEVWTSRTTTTKVVRGDASNTVSKTTSSIPRPRLRSMTMALPPPTRPPARATATASRR
jgi:hypothetical protein